MTRPEEVNSQDGAGTVPLRVILREWTRIGCTGFGGPPTHIAMLRRLCVDEHEWLAAGEFEDGLAAVTLLPGPASTQLAIFCAWRLRGALGALCGGLCFIVPGLVVIVALAALFLEHHPPAWVLGAAAGAGAAVPAVALEAARGFVPASWRRAGPGRGGRWRWVLYALVGVVGAVVVGAALVGVLVACGALEILARRGAAGRATGPAQRGRATLLAAAAHLPVVGGLVALTWVAFTVGALSYGGGFVIVPLMQHDVVSSYHWMTGTQFLDAVALGQVTPGPVVQTVAVVGYAAAGVGGALLAAVIAFAPSFAFVLAGAPRFDRIRRSVSVQAFFAGAGPAVIGAIAGSSITLGTALGHLWELGVLGLAALWLLALRRSVVIAIVAAGVLGAAAAIVGAPLGR